METVIAPEKSRTAMAPKEEVKKPVLADIMDPIVDAYLNRTAEEKKRFPPISWPGMKGNKKLAICGLAATTRHMAPFDDPTWDVWTMHMGASILKRVDLLFEPHDPLFEPYEPQYADILKTLKIPVMMQEHYPQFPTSIKLPFQELVDQFGRFFSTSVGWMMAMAIRNRYEEIHLFGVEMEHDTEYITQSKCVVYFIGIAEGRGIKIGLPHACQLMKNRWLYGIETAQSDEVIQRIDKHEAELGAQRQQLEAQLSSIQAQYHQCVGSLSECGQIKRRILLAD